MRKRIDYYELITAATTLPVSVADAKTHLGVTGSDHDTLIQDLIWGAVKAFEKRANVCLSAQSWKALTDKSYEHIELWKYPITGISSIQYYDANNSIQTLSSSYYFSNSLEGSNGYPRPAVVTVTTEPDTYERDDAFIINFTAGYSTIDYDIKQAILAYVFYMYEHRDNPVNERITFFDNVVSDNRSYGL